MPAKKTIKEPIEDTKVPTLRYWTVRLREIQASFNDIWEFVEGFTDNTTAAMVEVRLSAIDELWEKFCEVLVEIKSHDDFAGDETGFDNERKEFSNRYYFAKSFLLDRVKASNDSTVLDNSSRVADLSAQGVLDHVRLPQIKLQSFDGNIDDWLSFRDLYTSLIHWKQELPDVEKFHYLKGCLLGEPKAMIDPLKITKANYQVAWEMLLKRYNNSKQLKKRQIQSLFKLPTLTKESVGELHVLVEGFERIVNTLDQVVQSSDYKDLLLVNFLVSRLDPITHRAWEESSAAAEQDTLQELTEFLHRRIRVLESLPPKPSDSKNVQQVSTKPKVTRTGHSAVQSSGIVCAACKERHLLHLCPKFQKLTVMERDAILKTHNLCRNCFRSGHLARDCQSKFSCRHCQGRHHSMVCFRSERGDRMAISERGGNSTAHSSHTRELLPANTESESKVANTAATTCQTSKAFNSKTSHVLLATAVVQLENDMGIRFPARALLDSGSESNFITERLCQRMALSRKKEDISILGIGQAATSVKFSVTAKLCSRTTNFSRELKFLVLPKVTSNLPTSTINTETWAVPEDIELADPAFFESSKVDLVLGIESFFEFFVSGRRIPLGKQLPTLTESVFGWVVCGGAATSGSAFNVQCNMSVNESLEQLVSRFWECEEIGSAKTFTKEEKRCEQQFSSTVQRSSDGRYTVSLPKNEDILSKLGNSREIALRRLAGTERRLDRKEYNTFMEEYLLLDHMRLVRGDDTVQRCFLPHHPVIKEGSTTTKVRVVFDASCKTSTGISLNDGLLVGPVIQEDLRSIILRSRSKQVMIVADVEKMFRQIRLQESDRPLQSILWRPPTSKVVNVYELNTVTYGTKPAPFLATRTLQQLANDERHRFPLAFTEDTYMDDVITGERDTEAALELRIQLENAAAAGGFRLRKFASNSRRVLEGMPEENVAIKDPAIDLSSNSSVKILGLTWLPKFDSLMFQFNIPSFKKPGKWTKRQILSVIASLFDPLGLLGATVTTAKIFMQLLWTLQDDKGEKIDWDHPLPSTVGEIWCQYYAKLPLLNEIKVDRCVILPEAVRMELHCFSDASEKAYGGCIYIKSIGERGEVRIGLVSSKSRVAPLKSQSIPRLELNGALLTSELFEMVKGSMRFEGQVYFWTDSTCVWRWLQAVPSTWSTYVANRVSKIQNLIDGYTWRHVPGIDNPADLISRGISPEEIGNNRLWWQGPTWLQFEEPKWPDCFEHCNDETGEEERRKTKVVAVGVSKNTEFNAWFLERYSNYNVLIRHTAYLLRFRRFLLLRKAVKFESFLSTAELFEAESAVARCVQLECFPDEIQALSKGENVPRRSPLRWFNPFLDQNGIIRVGGRIRNSAEHWNTKHPIVLPARHHLTKLILEYYHRRLLHAGLQLLLATVRLRFWPLGGRNLARHIIHKCTTCFRVRPTPVQQFMGDLPAERIKIARPFKKVGVDFGPVYLRPVPRRAAVKGYVAVFICLCTKAVHLELVSDLSTERFLQAFHRFVARRGRCSDVYSDNGTNFVGARNKLKELFALLKDQKHREDIIQGLQQIRYPVALQPSWSSALWRTVGGSGEVDKEAPTTNHRRNTCVT
ncbi:uncharacterized protein LOC129741299 [Uranotaenia lowii]|uniref:uncharacterized protein LOC129741299 n=1 Tax=Uranotaenia lowii TaxID=190385 RepID=UPI00247973C8|nr:uncharacterized protein LOC129741299 [Uranotaenia lowii]